MYFCDEKRQIKLELPHSFFWNSYSTYIGSSHSNYYISYFLFIFSISFSLGVLIFLLIHFMVDCLFLLFFILHLSLSSMNIVFSMSVLSLLNCRSIASCLCFYHTLQSFTEPVFMLIYLVSIIYVDCIKSYSALM